MEQPKENIGCQDFALRRWQAESDFDALFRMIEESLDHLRPWMPWVARHSQQHPRLPRPLRSELAERRRVHLRDHHERRTRRQLFPLPCQ
ncbi:hypothetical protein ACFXJ5_09500 [Streptomyces sp. NPDC059373]